MPSLVNLPDDLVAKARRSGKVSRRSIPEQIVHWSTIGEIAEENPDLPYGFIEDILIGRQEVAEGLTTPSEFGR